MSLIPSADARAVVAAVDRLSTQLRRFLDGASTPAVGDPFPAGTCDASTLGVGSRHLGPCLLRPGHDGPVHRGPDGETWATVDATDDAPTTADDGPRCVCGDPIQLSGDPAGWIHSPGSDTPCLDPRPPAGIPNRVITHWGPLSEQRFEEMRDNARQLTDWITERAQQAPADEDAERTARRVSLRVLINRVNHGLALTADEAQLLAHHVATEITDANDRNRLAAELEQAQATIKRVRAVAADIARSGWTGSATARRISEALGGTDQPEEQRCKPGPYDETEEQPDAG